MIAFRCSRNLIKAKIVIIHADKLTKKRKPRWRHPAVFVLLGFGEDVLAALYVKSVEQGDAGIAAIVAVAITVLAVFVLREIVIEPKFLSWKLWSFALGNAMATYLVTRYYA